MHSNNEMHKHSRIHRAKVNRDKYEALIALSKLLIEKTAPKQLRYKDIF